MKRILIVGLGNPEPQYDQTRHNIGFQFLDYFAEQQKLSAFELGPHATHTFFKGKGVHLILIKPTTYMNLSGTAVKYWLKKEKLNPEQMLVITDDLHLPFGTIRLKPGGSDGGHNGFKHINQCLQTTQYPRLRFGIDNNFSTGLQKNYVLSTWKPQEQEVLPVCLKHCTEIMMSFSTIGIQKTMTLYNKKPLNLKETNETI